MSSGIRVWGLDPTTALRAKLGLAGLVLAVVVMELGWQSFLVGFAVAALPVPLYVALALWLDRFEREPAWMLAKAFAWGAVVSSFLSMVVNSEVQAYYAPIVGEEAAAMLMSVFSAPLSEELTKGLALYLLFRLHPDEFDNVTDGVVYAAMVGLGFAMTENILYYGRAVEMQAVGLLFVWRGLIGPFAHPLFTAMTGIGLGLARQTHRPVVRKVAPFAGITLAILLHALWNLSAPTDAGFLRMYAMVMVPTFVGVLLLVRRSLRQEAAILRRHLQALVEGGVLTRAELDLLCSEPQRVRALARCLLTGGLPAWRERRRFHQLAGDLAFHRWRVARGLTSDEAGDARREAAWLAEVAALAPRVG